MARSVLQGEGFSVSFSDREVTAWGGLALLKQMLDSRGFREAGAGWGLPEPGSNRGYAPLQLIEQFIVSIWCGACRFVHAETVRMDSTLVRLFGWARAAGHKAIMRLFARFDMLTNERVQAEVYRWFFGKISALKRVTLDVDSTVITRNGNQQGAARGYNPTVMDALATTRCWLLLPKPGWWPISGCGQAMRTAPTISFSSSNRPCTIWATRLSVFCVPTAASSTRRCGAFCGLRRKG